MPNISKKIIACVLFSALLVSCSPTKAPESSVTHDLTEERSADKTEQVSSDAGGNPYGPTEIYELDALNDDFLDQSFKLPYYNGKTHDQLYDLFINSANSFRGVSASINAILPDTVVFGRGNFAYDKQTGNISRTCKDPQCLHYHYDIPGAPRACSFITGVWMICKDRIFSNRVSINNHILTTTVFTTDFSFNDLHYANLPNSDTVEGVCSDGRLILLKQQHLPYIDKDGIQRYKGDDFELYLYDTESKEEDLVFAPGEVFNVLTCGNIVYCNTYTNDGLYALNEDREIRYIGKVKKILAMFDSKICYINEESGDVLCCDVQTGETDTWVDKDSPLTNITWSGKFGDRLYFFRTHTIDEIRALGFIDEAQLRTIMSESRTYSDGTFYAPIIYSCNTNGSDIKIVYYTPYYTITGFALDGEVLYTSGYGADKRDRFAAFDMSSGIELRINIPYSEYHYPGEYGYDENWRRGFN